MKKDRDAGLPASRPTALNAGLKLLSYGDKSAKELLRRLREKGYTEEEAAEAVQKLIEYRYLDDLAFARRIAERFKGRRNKRQLKWEIIRRGVSEDTAEEALKETEDDEDDWN